MHYVICGHRDHMKRVLEQVDTLEIEKSKFIKITAVCTEFREIVAMPRGGSSVYKKTENNVLEVSPWVM